MVLKFNSPFLSIAGQKERLANVGNTLLAAVTGKGVKSNTGQKTVDKVLGAAASNPFVTALPVAVARAPVAAATAGKAAIASLTPKQAVIAAVATPVVIGAVASNPKLIGKAAKAPSELARFGADAGQLIADPSIDNAKQLLKESPLIAGGIALGTAAAVGGGAVAALSNLATRQAIEDNTDAILNTSSPALAALPELGTGSPSAIPITPATQVIGRPASSSVTGRRKARKKPEGTNVRIQLLNQNTYIEAGA